MGQGSNRKVRFPSFQGSESHGEGISSIFQDLVTCDSSPFSSLN